jgi:hypothetical protein
MKQKLNLRFIQEVDSRVKAFTLARSGLHEFIIVNETHHSGKLERLVVLSRGKQHVWENFLIAKLFYDNLSSLEYEILYKSHLIDRREVYLGLKALNYLPKRLIVKRLIKLTELNLLEMPEYSWYLGCRSQIVSFLLREKKQTRPFKKYSGYIKHYNDHGNLPSEDKVFPLETTEEFEILDDVLFHFLTVGSFPYGGNISFPDDGLKESETVKKIT